MEENEEVLNLTQLQARAYLKGVQDILASFDEAATVMVNAGLSEELTQFLTEFSTHMRMMRAQIFDKFEAMGVNVDGLGW